MLLLLSYLSLVKANSEVSQRFFTAEAKSFREVFDRELCSLSLTTADWQLHSTEFLNENTFV